MKINPNEHKEIVLLNPLEKEIIIEQDAASSLHLYVIFTDTISADITIRIEQQGEHTSTQLRGLVIGTGQSNIQVHTIVNHNLPNGHSNQLFKYVLMDQAKASFVGQLHVKPNAQKTEAYQTNKNILLSDDAQMRTQPQLEIYADDVKCSHGASTGQLDQTAIFYMQQRGISLAHARRLLLEAFCSEVISPIQDNDQRETIAKHINQLI